MSHQNAERDNKDQFKRMRGEGVGGNYFAQTKIFQKLNKLRAKIEIFKDTLWGGLADARVRE